MHLLLDTALLDNIVLIEYIICYCVQLKKLMLIIIGYILSSEGNYNFLLTDLPNYSSHKISSASATGFSRKGQELSTGTYTFHFSICCPVSLPVKTVMGVSWPP